MSEFGVGIVIAVLIWLIGSVLRLLGRIADDVAVIREKLDTAN